MDPVTVTKVWLLIRPARRIKTAINRRRARKGKPLLVIGDVEDEAMGKEIVGSFVRTLLPFVTAYLAGQGVTLGDEVSPVVTIAVAVAVYGAMQIWSIVRKVINKPRNVG